MILWDGIWSNLILRLRQMPLSLGVMQEQLHGGHRSTLSRRPFRVSRSTQTWTPWRSSVATSHGYALPLVLLAVAAFLLFASETSARVVREVRVTKVKENADAAFYAAEAGFNRVRARIIRQATDPQIASLDGRTDSLTYLDDDGNVHTSGAYTIQVTKLASPANTWSVVSTGVSGSSTFATKRIVSGTVQVTSTKTVKFGNTTTPINVVVTTYSP
jgi:hypothetical protein